MILRYHWWQEVYYKIDDSDFPSDTREMKGHFVGIAEHVGHAMSFKILTANTNRIIVRSNVRAADDSPSANLRLDLFDGEKDSTERTEIVKSYINDDKA